MPGVADRGHQHAGEAPVQGPGSEGSRGERLDSGIRGPMEMREGLEVREVPRPRPVVHGDHEAGPLGIAADPTRGLDVLGGALGLPGHHHEAEPGDIDTDLEHAGGQHDVHGLGLGWVHQQCVQGGGRRSPAHLIVS